MLSTLPVAQMRQFISFRLANALCQRALFGYTSCDCNLVAFLRADDSSFWAKYQSHIQAICRCGRRLRICVWIYRFRRFLSCAVGACTKRGRQLFLRNRYSGLHGRYHLVGVDKIFRENDNCHYLRISCDDLQCTNIGFGLRKKNANLR